MYRPIWKATENPLVWKIWYGRYGAVGVEELSPEFLNVTRVLLDRYLSPVLAALPFCPEVERETAFGSREVLGKAYRHVDIHYLITFENDEQAVMFRLLWEVEK